jgi:hypothetical protein
MAQSTALLAGISGMKRVRAATWSVDWLPPSSSPGWKMGAPAGSWFSSARTWLLLRMKKPDGLLTMAPSVPAIVNELAGSLNPQLLPGRSGRNLAFGFGARAVISPTSSTSVGMPSISTGSNWPGGM